MNTLDRRALLISIAAGIGAGGLGLISCRRADPLLLVEPASDLAAYAEHLTAIGQTFLEENPRESLERVADWLAGALDWDDSLPAAELSRRLAARIRDDFEGRKITLVGGWVLSETETRWCALIALKPL